MMRSIPASAFVYTPFAMFFAAIHIVLVLTLLKPDLYHSASLLPAALLVIDLGFIYRRFGFKQSIITIIVAMAALLLFYCLCQIAVTLPAAASWPSQTLYAEILQLSWWHIAETVFICFASEMLLVALLSFIWPTQQDNCLYYFFPFIAMFFVTILMTCNITTQKIANVFGITVDVGTWFFPFVFIFNNIFTEIYGYAASRIVIWSGLLINTLLAFLLALAVFVPAHHWYKQAAFAMIAGMTFRIVFASMISYFCSEFTNSYILAKLKILTQGRWLWTRTIGSTAVAMVVDSVLFTAIAFAGVIPFALLVKVACFQYLIKVSFEILFTPVTYAIVIFLKHKECIDFYDYHTRFNPFLVWKIAQESAKL